MKNNIYTTQINDMAIGTYMVVINHNNNTVTTILDDNAFMYKFEKDELNNKIQELNLNIDINDFIINFILGDEELTEYHLNLIGMI